MGSITEEELVQMVRDFMESEPTPKIADPIPLMNHGQPSYMDTLQEIIWRATDSEAEVLEKIMMYVRNMGCFREASNLNKLVVLRLKRDGFEASLCKTSWISFHGLAKGDYEFVDVMIRGDHPNSGKGRGTTTRLMVDMDFRSQFEVARPTQSYKELVHTLPSVFVGTEEKLGSVVSLLCSAAKQSLKESGLHIPPWRRASFMLTKWFSENCKRVAI